MAIDPKVIDELLAGYEKPEDIIGENGLLKQLTKALVERCLEGEMNTHLGYEKDERAGKSEWEAIVGSTVRRFRPITLTAAASVLAMIPLTRQVFWGPMAVAIMGGLIVATVLTCLFLPALYAAWFRVREPDADSGVEA